MMLKMLRAKTRKMHNALECTPLLTSLLEAPTLEVYTGVLSCFYGFYAPLERTAFPNAIATSPSLLPFFSQKLPLITQDLHEHGIDPIQLPECIDLPQCTTLHEWLGVFYTLEGSSMGRKMLWPRLQKTLQLSQGGSFFSEASQNTRETWSSFLQDMQALVRSQQAETELINGSLATFSALRDWFTKSSPL